ncbi:MAG TPA: hypothetical protein DIT05_01765 [Morganella sp. (in: Bacteria)]|nr:hypothetical protein [Morganella sp. (in: enterobacteria)]
MYLTERAATMCNTVIPAQYSDTLLLLRILLWTDCHHAAGRRACTRNADVMTDYKFSTGTQL